MGEHAPTNSAPNLNFTKKYEWSWFKHLRLRPVVSVPDFSCVSGLKLFYLELLSEMINPSAGGEGELNYLSDTPYFNTTTDEYDIYCEYAIRRNLNVGSVSFQFTNSNCRLYHSRRGPSRSPSLGGLKADRPRESRHTEILLSDPELVAKARHIVNERFKKA